MTNEEFVSMADPHMWLLTADNLHEQAIALKGRAGQGRLIHTNAEGRSWSWDNTERSTMLLAAFALENALKAFLVYENPHWISNGRLAKQLRSHNLLKLRDQCELIPYRSRYSWVLRFYSEGIESWARYPCGLTADETKTQANLSASMWHGYLTLMQAFGRKLELLLKKGWHGPHGQGGTWDCETMEFLRH